MKRAAIVNPAAPSAPSGGSLRSVPVEVLGATVAKAVVRRTRLDPARLDDVIFASRATPTARRPAPTAGWRCRPAGWWRARHAARSALRAACRSRWPARSAMMVPRPAPPISVLAGSVENMNVEYYTTDMRWGSRAAASLHGSTA